MFVWFCVGMKEKIISARLWAGFSAPHKIEITFTSRPYTKMCDESERQHLIAATIQTTTNSEKKKQNKLCGSSAFVRPLVHMRVSQRRFSVIIVEMQHPQSKHKSRVCYPAIKVFRLFCLFSPLSCSPIFPLSLLWFQFNR